MLTKILYATKILKNIYIYISKKLKLRLKNTTIDKTLTYAPEIWILTEIERKVYWRILGPVYDNEKEKWRLTNKETYAMVKKPTITQTIRLNRVRWFGHVETMGENRIPKEVLYMNLENIRRPRGRPRNRW